MSKVSPLDKVLSFSQFLSNKPDFLTLVEYLSITISPNGELCGVAVGVLNDRDFIDTTLRLGFKISVNTIPEIHLDSEYPLAISLKTQEIIIIDLVSTLEKFPTLPQEYLEIPYRSICFIPLSKSLIFFLAFESSEEEISSYIIYFECVRSLMIMYMKLQNRKFINEYSITGSLSPRQKMIQDLILLGKSNREIAEKLAYSLSLIRQETMRIYAKLGVNGRNELKSLIKKS